MILKQVTYQIGSYWVVVDQTRRIVAETTELYPGTGERPKHPKDLPAFDPAIAYKIQCRVPGQYAITARLGAGSSVVIGEESIPHLVRITEQTRPRTVREHFCRLYGPPELFTKMVLHGIRGGSAPGSVGADTQNGVPSTRNFRLEGWQELAELGLLEYLGDSKTGGYGQYVLPSSLPGVTALELPHLQGELDDAVACEWLLNGCQAQELRPGFAVKLKSSEVGRDTLDSIPGVFVPEVTLGPNGAPQSNSMAVDFIEIFEAVIDRPVVVFDTEMLQLPGRPPISLNRLCGGMTCGERGPVLVNFDRQASEIGVLEQLMARRVFAQNVDEILNQKARAVNGMVGIIPEEWWLPTL